LFEIEDLPWCPDIIRDGGTDWLGFMANTTKVFSAVAPKIRTAMAVSGTNRIIDLCSGGGGPWPTLVSGLSNNGSVTVELSDLYPNIEAFRALSARTEGRLGFHARPVDATHVPEGLNGLRTMFNAFHHFSPNLAAAILTDAVRQRRPIAIFEGIAGRAMGFVFMPLQLPAVLLLTPFVRPFRWSRLLFTYVIPLIPLLVLFDGTMSLLRIYLEDDLRQLVSSVSGQETFAWDIGTTRIRGNWIGITHLVGVPRNEGVGRPVEPA
jgi:hypothetical protein